MPASRTDDVAASRPASTRYERLRILGRGSTGTVYEALDRSTGSVVALKTIHAASPELLLQLKREFRSLADLEHENFVRYLELASEDGEWFFTMERVIGLPFDEYVRPGDVLDEARLRSCLAQLVDALMTLHAAGHVHCDVKPSNVLVSEDGRVVLLDFGLVSAAQRTAGGGAGAEADADQTARAAIGTPAYMAPEQVEGLPTGPPADWYAVGTMLFRALTGKRPFDGSAPDLLLQKLTSEAPPPHALVPEVARDLDELCIDLLRSKPELRSSGDMIRAKLRLPSVRTTEGGIFVGRREELRRLRGAFDALLQGASRSIVVEGEPGMGKTALVAQFLAQLPADAVILTGRCYEQESVPFNGADTVVDALTTHLVRSEPEELDAVLAGGTRFLASVFRVLCAIPAIAEDVVRLRGVESEAIVRDQAFDELSRIISALARRHPLVVFLDDLQWAARDSAALLARAILPGSGARCLFVATLRTGMEVSPAIAEIVETAERIELHALSDDDALTLWMNQRPGEQDDITLRDAAVREAAGRPLFLSELARVAGVVRAAGDAPVHLKDLLWQRISARDPVDTRFLEMTSIASRPLPVGVLADAAGLEVGECATRIAGLRAARLVRVSRIGADRIIEPYHDRIRETVVDQLGAAGRTESMHRDLGRALLAATDPSQLGARIFTIVHHLNAARRLAQSPDERRQLAELNLLAGEEARLATTYGRSLDHLRTGLELLGDDAWSDAYSLTRDLYLARLAAEYLDGNRKAARRVFEATRAHLTTAEDATHLYTTWIQVETGGGHYSEAIDAAGEHLRELGDPLPGHPGKLDLLVNLAMTRFARGRRSIEELEHLPSLQDPKRLRVLTVLEEAIGAAYFARPATFAWIILHAARISMRHGLSPLSPFCFCALGMLLTRSSKSYSDALRFAELGRRLERAYPNAYRNAAKLQLAYAVVVSWRRPFAEAVDEHREVYRLASRLGDIAYMRYSSTAIVQLMISYAPHLSMLSEEAERARGVAIRHARPGLAATMEAVAAYAAALRGQTAAPHELTLSSSSAADSYAASGESQPQALWEYHLNSAELSYLFGRLAEARTHLEEAEKRRSVARVVPRSQDLLFLDALVRAMAFAQENALGRAKCIIRVALRARTLAGWARTCPANFKACALIVRAELRRICGRHGAAARTYAQAITAAREYGTPKYEAIALELAAGHARQRRRSEAIGLHREAIAAYRQWGAEAKALAMESA